MASNKKRKHRLVAADKPIQKIQPQHALSRTNKTSYFLALLLILASALLYGHSLWNPLVFDDAAIFVEVTLERLGSSFFHLDLRWFPYASFGWTYKLVGTDWFWYRLGNLALHSFTTVLLFVFFSRLLHVTKSQANTTLQPPWSAFFAALIFALHPVAVYGVAYLVQRSILMATLFGIAALLCYMEGLTRDKTKWFLLSALFYFLAVFSKEHSIMLPGVAAALTLLMHKPSFSLIKRVWLPFSLYLVIAIIVILRTKGLLGTAYEPRAVDMLAQLSEHQMGTPITNVYPLSIITQGYLFFKYLLLWIIPNVEWMSVDLRQPFATHLWSWPQLPGFILFLVYPVLAIKLLLKGERLGLLGFGLLFPWILFLTELSSVRIQEPFVLYRSYLWMSGLPILILSLLTLIGAHPGKFIPVLLGFCLILASLAWNRLDTFSTPLKLWSDAIAKNQDRKSLGAEIAYNNRGSIHMDLGHIQRAKEDFIKAVTLNPKYGEAHLNMCVVNFRLKDFSAALRDCNTAINLRPNYIKARIDRSALFLEIGKYADAINDCEHVLQLDAQNIDAYLNCGLAYSSMGKLHEALRYLDNALRVDSKNAIAYFHRGFLHNSMGQYQNALQDYSKAIDFDTNYADAYLNRAVVFLKMRRYSEAFRDFDRAVQLNPKNPFYYSNRAAANFSLGKFQEALEDYDKVLSLDAKDNQALVYRELALNMLNRKKR